MNFFHKEFFSFISIKPLGSSNSTITPNCIIIIIKGIGLELVKQFLALPTPPRNIFATYRSKERSGKGATLYIKTYSSRSDRKTRDIEIEGK